ncbi:MAG: 1-acyl-sn-glycerol-3-phosphate acyltransferase, partial [Candidatus Hydrogenedentes bacterium]|nr:1-acyl-sn-glycerol-3-phosphate acyltransferase [Candidatus Hydrogenedentota bacterium]
MGKTAYWESVIVEVQRPGRVNISLHLLGVFLLKILGWKVKGEPPDVPKVVVVVAPHTSYWDYPLALLVSWHFRIKGAWFGKAEIFDWPLVGWIFPGTGGIPVYKDRHEGLVDQIVQAFQERDEIMLVLTPKGTRKKMEFWRSGFYRIALQSGAPISL